MTTASLVGKLREHELVMKRLNVQENEDKHVRNISPKAAGHKNSQDSSDDSGRETLSLLTRKFSKFLKKITTIINLPTGIITRNSIILTITNIPALVVVNKDILKLIAPIMRAKKEQQARKVKKRQS